MNKKTLLAAIAAFIVIGLAYDTQCGGRRFRHRGGRGRPGMHNRRGPGGGLGWEGGRGGNPPIIVIDSKHFDPKRFFDAWEKRKSNRGPGPHHGPRPYRFEMIQELRDAVDNLQTEVNELWKKISEISIEISPERTEVEPN